MQHIFAGQLPSAGEGWFGVADRPMLADPSVAFALDGFPTLTGNRPGHPAAVLELTVGGVDNRLHGFEGQVALNDFKFLSAGQSFFAQKSAHATIVPRRRWARNFGFLIFVFFSAVV